MIYFITKRKHNVQANDILIQDNLGYLCEYLSNLDLIGYDKEFNGLNELYTTPLLTVFGDEKVQFVIDDTSIDLSPLKQFETKKFIGHNIKIDIKVARFHQGLNFRNLYDTMIVEQRLGLGSMRPNTLEATYLRRCGKPMPEGKAIRDEFTKMDRGSEFSDKHIRYAAGDIAVLFPIKKEQERLITKFNYHHLLFNIEFPLISLLADAELEGFYINKEQWEKNIRDNKDKQLELEREMDEELSKLGIFKYNRQRKIQEVIQTSLFPSLIEEKISSNLNKGRINYGSPKEVLSIFDKLGIDRPVFERKVQDKTTGVKTKETTHSIGEEALNLYLIKYPKTKLRVFIEALLEHKGVTKNIDAFGRSFLLPMVQTKTSKKLGFKNNKTGKVHTIYRQCMSKTGRLQSGDAKIGFYNSQQIPARKEYRHPFTLSQQEIENDWWITTSDLTGAEAVIMCAFAKDKQLYKWAVEEDDLHSPVATECYRQLYKFRKLTKKPLILKDSYNKQYELTEHIVIDKHNNKQLRTDFKSVTFGVIYGAGARTIADTLNVPKEEAQFIIDIIQDLFKDTIEMVKERAEFAKVYGYVLHNTRSNSRKYFPPIIRGGTSREELVMVEQEARNCIIQGTQADLLKEAMVEIDKEFTRRNVPNCLLLQVHDELVWKHKGKENGLIIPNLMGEVATKYLEGFTVMKAEAETLHHWTK